MLEKLQLLACRHAWARPALLLLALLGLGYCSYVVVSSRNEAEDIYLIPSMLLFVWATMLHSFLNLFAQVPTPVPVELKGWQRLKARCRRGAYHVFAWLIVLLSLLLVVTTLQLFGAWRTMY